MAKIQDIKTMPGASMQLDVDDKLLKNNMFREIYNLIFDKLAAHYYPGNKLNNNSLLNPTGIYKYLGGCKDVKREAFIFFLHHAPAGGDAQHGIFWYFTKTKTFQRILVSPVLNFQTDHPILGAVVVGDLLYWTDGYEEDENPFEATRHNPPRKINLVKASNYITKEYFNCTVTWHIPYIAYDRGEFVLYTNPSGTVRIFKSLKPIPVSSGIYPPNNQTSNENWGFIEEYSYKNSYLQPITTQVLDRIKRPPSYPPVLISDKSIDINEISVNFKDGYGTDYTTRINFLRRKQFQFSYRYIYDDNEMSCWSDLSMIPRTHYDELADGSFPVDPYLNNVIGVNINTGPEEVVRIEVAVKESGAGNWKIVNRIYKYNEHGKIISSARSNLEYNYLFYNNTFAEGVSQDDVFRVYDYVPQIVLGTELIEENRLLDSNFIEGYDNVMPNMELSLIHHENDLTEIADNLVVQLLEVTGWPGEYYAIEFPLDIVEGMTFVVNIEWFKIEYWWTVPFQQYMEEITELTDVYAYYTSVEGDTLSSVMYNIRIILRRLLGEDIYGFPWDVFSLATVGGPVNVLYISEREEIKGDNYIHIFEKRITKVTASVIRMNDRIKTHKSGSSIQLGIQYQDPQGRAGAVNSLDSLKILIPFYTQNYENQDYYTNLGLHDTLIKWSIFHKPPMWASSFQIMATRSNISWYQHFHVSSDNISIGSAPAKTLININADVKIHIDSRPLTNLPYYTWEKGDRIRFLLKKYDNDLPDDEFIYFDSYMDYEILGVEYPDADPNTLPEGGYMIDMPTTDENWAFILDKDGNKVYDPAKMKIVLQVIDGLGDVIQIGDPKSKIVVEIYRVRKDLADDENSLFYTIGEKFPIINPHTNNRAHSGGNGIYNYSPQNQSQSLPAVGYLAGGRDSFIRIREFGGDWFPCEDLNYSDYYPSSMTDFGRVGIIDRNMQRKKFITGLRYGGKYFENTEVNDLSKFLWDDFDSLPERYGPIIKIKEIGFTLKVKQVQKMTSIYIGRAGLYQADDSRQNVISASDKVLGAKMTSENYYGLSTPEAYCTNGKDEYFVDVINGVIIRNSNNGPYPISEYGIKEWVKDKCHYLLNTCSEYHIFAGYDGYYDFVLFTFVGLKPDKQHDINTVVFNERENQWITFLHDDIYGKPIEGYLGDGMDLFGFYQGKMWEYDDGNPLELYGIKRVPSITAVANVEPMLVKLFKSISVYSPKVWYAKEYGDINISRTSNHSRGMSSRLPAEHFESMEGVHRAAFLRNAVTSSTSPNLTDLVNGQELRGETMEIRLTCDERDEDVSLTGILIDAQHSKRSGE